MPVCTGISAVIKGTFDIFVLEMAKIIFFSTGKRSFCWPVAVFPVSGCRSV
jgi:hypothetical protein